MSRWLLTLLAWMMAAQVAADDTSTVPSNHTTLLTKLKHGTSNDTRCGPSCVRCGVEGCLKCGQLAAWHAGGCVGHCPRGTRAEWARDDTLMGRVCYPHHYYNEIAVGAVCGALVCALVAAAGLAYWRRRSRDRPRRAPTDDADDAALREFHKQLDCLRPHAHTLLTILNHTRHQVRELYHLGNNDAAVAYSSILSDLAKLLILLNKQHLPVVPNEWPRLAAWADRILKRYSQLTDDQRIHEHQLVNFLPSPPGHGAGANNQHSFSTFKPPSYSPVSYSSSLDKDNENNVWSDFGRPPSYSQIEQERHREIMTLSDPWERRRIVRRESVWLEDELFEMMRRPQDELTTEL